MVYNLCFNEEINHPKSTCMYKSEWTRFRSEHFTAPWEYINDYAAVKKGPYKRDHTKWNTGPENLAGGAQRTKS